MWIINHMYKVIFKYILTTETLDYNSPVSNIYLLCVAAQVAQQSNTSISIFCVMSKNINKYVTNLQLLK